VVVLGFQALKDYVTKVLPPRWSTNQARGPVTFTCGRRLIGRYGNRIPPRARSKLKPAQASPHLYLRSPRVENLAPCNGGLGSDSVNHIWASKEGRHQHSGRRPVDPGQPELDGDEHPRTAARCTPRRAKSLHTG